MLATVDDYAAVYPLVDAVLGQASAERADVASETYEALPTDSDANRGINYSRLGSVLGIGPDAARDRRSSSWNSATRSTARRDAGRQHSSCRRPDPRGEGFLPTPAALRALLHTPPAPGETDPNARNATEPRMGKGFELRLTHPKSNPKPEIGTDHGLRIGLRVAQPEIRDRTNKRKTGRFRCSGRLRDPRVRDRHGGDRTARRNRSRDGVGVSVELPPIARVVVEAAVARFVGRPFEENPYDSIHGEAQHHAWAWRGGTSTNC